LYKYIFGDGDPVDCKVDEAVIRALIDKLPCRKSAHSAKEVMGVVAVGQGTGNRGGPRGEMVPFVGRGRGQHRVQAAVRAAGGGRPRGAIPLMDRGDRDYGHDSFESYDSFDARFDSYDSSQRMPIEDGYARGVNDQRSSGRGGSQHFEDMDFGDGSGGDKGHSEIRIDFCSSSFPFPLLCLCLNSGLNTCVRNF
jgi:hypothetical protein